MKLKKGDKVILLSGQDKGRSGLITRALPRQNKVVVEGINLHKKTRKPTNRQPRGGIIEISQPLWVSKVALVSSKAKNSALDEETSVKQKAGNRAVSP